MNKTKTLDERSEEYFQTAFTIANTLDNPHNRARMMCQVIRESPERHYELRIKQKPKTRWLACILGLGLATTMYAGGVLYNQNRELEEKVSNANATVQSREESYAQEVKSFEERTNDFLDKMGVLKEQSRENERELETTLQSYRTFLEVTTNKDLGRKKFERKARFDKFVELYRNNLGMRGEGIFERLLYEQMHNSVIPLEGKTQDETINEWNEHPTTLKYFMLQNAGVKP